MTYTSDMIDLREQVLKFLNEHEISALELSKRAGIPSNAITRILSGYDVKFNRGMKILDVMEALRQNPPTPKRRTYLSKYRKNKGIYTPKPSDQ